MSTITSVKPNMASIEASKPNMKVVNGSIQVTYYDTKTIYKGSPMGLLLTITYPEELIFNTVRM